MFTIYQAQLAKLNQAYTAQLMEEVRNPIQTIYAKQFRQLRMTEREQDHFINSRVEEYLALQLDSKDELMQYVQVFLLRLAGKVSEADFLKLLKYTKTNKTAFSFFLNHS